MDRIQYGKWFIGLNIAVCNCLSGKANCNMGFNRNKGLSIINVWFNFYTGFFNEK